MYVCAIFVYEWQSKSSSRSERLGFSPEEWTPQLFSSAEWTKLLSWSTRKCNACFSPSSSQLRFPLCSESRMCIFLRDPECQGTTSPVGAPPSSRALAPFQQDVFYFYTSSGLHQESVQLSNPLVTVANSKCLQVIKGQGKLIEMLPNTLLQHSTAEGNWKGQL